jgi:hypothetical protein
LFRYVVREMFCAQVSPRPHRCRLGRYEVLVHQPLYPLVGPKNIRGTHARAEGCIDLSEGSFPNDSKVGEVAESRAYFRLNKRRSSRQINGNISTIDMAGDSIWEYGFYLTWYLGTEVSEAASSRISALIGGLCYPPRIQAFLNQMYGSDGGEHIRICQLVFSISLCPVASVDFLPSDAEGVTACLGQSHDDENLLRRCRSAGSRRHAADRSLQP